jgi:hypothetical protein
MERSNSKPNLFIQLAKQKSEQQNSKKTSGFLGETQVRRFPNPLSDRRGPFRGGRNGQGKPS